jgi:hypothetical protein
LKYFQFLLIAQIAGVLIPGIYHHTDTESERIKRGKWKRKILTAGLT